MLRKSSLAAVLLCAAFTLAFTNPAYASVYQTVDLSTGINVGLSGNPPYPPNGRDDYLRVRSVPGNPSMNVQSWIILMGVGWNTIPGTQPIYGNNNNVGTSEYERCFCLQSTEKAQLSLTMRADNKANLFLNSYFANPIMLALVNNTFAASVPPVQFTYTAQNGLKVGRNCIRVRVNNEGGPTGFALKATLQGFGAQDTAEEACCRQGGAVFSEALRGRPDDLNPSPGPTREILQPGRVEPMMRPPND